MRQPQAGRADLAARGAEGAAAAAEARPAVAGRRLLHPAAAGAAKSRLGLRLRRGPDPGRPEVPDAVRGRRVHPRGAGDPGGAEARLGRGDRRPGRPVHRPRRARAHPLGQRAGVRGQGGEGVDRRRRRQDGLHRTRQPVGERLRRELQRQAPRRAAGRRGVQHAHGSPGADRTMARALLPRITTPIWLCG